MTLEEYILSLRLSESISPEGLAATYDFLDTINFRERVWEIVREAGGIMHGKDPETFNSHEFEMALWTYLTDVMFHPFAGMSIEDRQKVAVRYGMMMEAVLSDAPENPGEELDGLTEETRQ